MRDSPGRNGRHAVSDARLALSERETRRVERRLAMSERQTRRAGAKTHRAGRKAHRVERQTHRAETTDPPPQNARLTAVKAGLTAVKRGTRRGEMRDSPCRKRRLALREGGLSFGGACRTGGRRGCPGPGRRSPCRRAGPGGCRTGRRTVRRSSRRSSCSTPPGCSGGRGAAATPAAGRTPTAGPTRRRPVSRRLPARRLRAVPGRAEPGLRLAVPGRRAVPGPRPEPRRAEAGGRVGRGRDAAAATPRPTVPADVPAHPLRTPAALDEVPRHVLRRLEEPLVVGAAAGAAAVPLREQPHLLHPRPDLPAQDPAAERREPAAEPGDRVPERRPVAVAAPLAVELELVALVRADVGVVAREGDQRGHGQIMIYRNDIGRAAVRLQLGARR